MLIDGRDGKHGEVKTIRGGGVNIIVKFACTVAAALALALSGGAANAQGKSLKDRLTGTWHFVIAEITAPDGKKSYPFGPKPRGMVIFTPGRATSCRSISPAKCRRSPTATG